MTGMTAPEPVYPDDYRSYPVCKTRLGDLCLVLSGRRADSDYRLVVTDVSRDRPHSGRELRTGAVSR